MTDFSRARGEQARATSLLLGLFLALSASGAVDLRLGGSDSPDPAVTGSNLVYTLTVTNIGNTTATNVAITNVLSSTVNFFSVTTTRGSCSNVSGTVFCNWGNLAANAGGRVTLTVRPNAPGSITNRTSAGTAQGDADSSNNFLTLLTTAVNRRTFSSSDFIQMEEVLASPAVPYPSIITVSGLTAAVHKVTVTLNNVSHNFPDDMDIMLVGPQGQHLMLVSDALTDLALTDIVITFDDAAAEPVPNTNAISSGSFQPVNYGSLPDVMPEPAPPGPHFLGFTPLSIFNGTDPNGAWRLFVYDDEPEWGGWIDGWSIAVSTLEPMAHLNVTTMDTPDPSVPGQTISYTTIVSNAGPANATGVWVTNRVAPGLELLSFSVSRGACTNADGMIYCHIGAMAAGASEQLTVQTRATNSGTYTNQANVAGAQLDTQPANNSFAETTLVEPRIDLGLGLSASRNPALLEQPLVYTVAVTNFGPDAARGVRVVDELPPGVVLVNSAASQGGCTNQAGVVTCDLGTLASQARATVLFTCRPTVLGPITNLVTLSAIEVDSNPANDSAQDINSVEPAADLMLTITDSPDPVPMTQPLTYVITVTNRGPNVASNVVISDVLPASMVFLSVQSTHGACTNSGNSVGCVIEQFAPGERAVITLVAAGNAPGSVANTATVIGQPTDPNIGNNTASATTLVSSAVDIIVFQASDRPMLWQGDRIIYTLIVSNAGPSGATAARLSDPLPAGLGFVSASASAGSCSLQAGTVFCNLGDLASRGFATVSIIAIVNAAGAITNVATATANEFELDPNNNMASLVSSVIPKTASFNDPAPILIPELGTASPYPSIIHVFGLTAAVQRVRVVLSNFSHTYPDDVDMLLEGPDGRSLVLMSDVGGATARNSLNLIFDDGGVTLPDNAPLTTGVFQPTDHEGSGNEFPPPAPSNAHDTFATFTNTDPNGAWKLYVVDDAAKDSGAVAGGWSLDFFTRGALADLEVQARMLPDLVAVSDLIAMTITVSNRGPAAAGAVTLTNLLGPHLMFVSANASQGTCANEGDIVRCELGALPSGNTASVQISFRAAASGSGTNFIQVSSAELDVNLTNNSARAAYTAEHAPLILTQPESQIVRRGSTATFSASVSGDEPLTYQWFHGETAIPDATNTSLVLTNVQSEVVGGYQLLVTNRVGLALSAVARLDLTRPPTIDLIPDFHMGEDEVLVVPLTVSDPDPFETFEVSAACDDTNLVPATNITVTLNGTNYALVIRPATNQFGTNMVTVTATDSGGLLASRSFTLGVQSINDYPHFVLPVGDQVIDEDSSIEVPFVIGDVETIGTSLIVGLRSHNLVLVPDHLFWAGGGGSNWYVHISAVSNLFGTALLEIRVRDEAQVRTTNLFNLTVRPVEDPPTLATIDDVVILEDTELMVGFEARDPESAIENLRFRAESSNTNLFANDAFTFNIVTGSMRGRPLPNQFGVSTITVFVEDEAGRTASTSFQATVSPENDLPSISAIPPVVTMADQPSEPVFFTVGDVETAAESLTLSGFSTNSALLLDAAIEFGGDGSNRTVRITPQPGQFGWMVARVEVIDGDGGTSAREFEVLVHQTNGPPIIVLQPQHQDVSAGAPVSLRVVATGPGPLFHQWERDGEGLAGETNAILAIASAVSTNRGMYRVVISNAEGTVTSDTVRLLVLEGTRIESITHNGAAAEITFTTAANHLYHVEYQDDLGPDPWILLQGINGTGEPVTVTDSDASVSRRFYRVRVEPAPLP